MPDRLAARNAAIHKRHARRVSELTDLLQILQRNGGEEYDRQIRPSLRQDTVRTIQDVARLLRIDDGDQHDVALAGDLHSGRSNSRHAFQSIGLILTPTIYLRQPTATDDRQTATPPH